MKIITRHTTRRAGVFAAVALCIALLGGHLTAQAHEGPTATIRQRA